MTKNVGFTAEERAAMVNRARELAAEAKAGKNKAKGESDVLEAIAKMPEPDRTMAKRIHDLIKVNAPTLSPKTWYGMPAYANQEEKVVCFFQNAAKFKYRYSTLGFQQDANLDEGNMWATSYAIMKLTSAEEKKIVELVKKAVR